MDGTTFDNLIKRLSSRRLTRLRALQGLATATTLVFAGAGLTTEGTGAVERKRTICHCGDNNPQQINCVTRRLKRKRAKRHLRRHQYDYKGKCRNNPTVGCSPANNPQGSCPGGQICNTKSICVTAGCLDPANPQCPVGEVCCPSTTRKAGQCVPNANAC